MKEVHISVRGKVQGVNFRHDAVITAERLGLTGFCMNKPDGTVFLLAQGDDDAIDEFINWTKVGSKEADVAEVAVTESTIEKHYEGFKKIIETI